jgi:transcriptional regulator with XRE-family HTH domain
MPRLRAIRAALLLTQGQLADRAHLGQTTICSIEAGRSRPRHRTIERIADALGVEPEMIDEFHIALAPPAPETSGAR